MAEVKPITTNSDEEPQPLSGTIAGRFIIGDRLGHGGMGEVYRAEDNRLKRTVALKRLAPSLRADAAYRPRFRQECLYTRLRLPLAVTACYWFDPGTISAPVCGKPSNTGAQL